MISRGRIVMTIGVSIALMVSASACGSSSGGSSRSKPSALNFVAFEPYSGAEAVFGPENEAGCLTAVRVINESGGVLGHSMKCPAVDSRSDAADAVTAARKLIATTSNLVGIVGPSTNEAPSTVPVFNQAKVVMFAQTGDPAYDHNTFAYFYRPTPADDVNGYSMALWAHQKGYTRAAAIFGNDVAGQGVVPDLKRGFAKLGGTIVSDERLVLDQSSYRTEVARMVASNPQVIFTELDPQTAATFFGDLKQQHGMIPVIGDGGTIGYPAWVQAVEGAIGAADMRKYYAGVQIFNPRGGPAWSLYHANLLRSGVKKPEQYSADPYTQTDYDGVIIASLAMVASKSIKPSVFNPFMRKVSGPNPGATVVHTFKDGTRALAAGKTIRYIGPGGPQTYNRWNNSEMDFEADSVDAKGNTVRTGLVAASAVARLAS